MFTKILETKGKKKTKKFSQGARMNFVRSFQENWKHICHPQINPFEKKAINSLTTVMFSG